MNGRNRVPDYDEIWTQVYGDRERSGPVNRHVRRMIRNVLMQIEYQRVLDVGCGPGLNLSTFSHGRSLKRVTGVDISAWAIERACEVGYEGYQLDIQEGRLDGCWDLVFSSLLLEHIADDVAALANMRAMTGKYLVVTTIAGDFERYKAWDCQMGHVRNYRVGELEAKLVQTGFNVLKAMYWGFPFYSPFGRTLQNFMKASSTFGIKTRLIAEIMYYLYFLNSHKRGDLLIILASV